MEARYLTLFVVLGIITLASPAYAVQLDAAIPSDSEEFVPSFAFTRVISIEHAEDSRLAQLIGDQRQIISFEIDSQNAADLITQINSKLQAKSFVTVKDISGSYTATITPNAQSTTIEYKMVLYPVMQGHFISVHSLDSQWRGFDIKDEIPIETKYGTYDINSPLSAFIILPGVAEYIQGTAVADILDMNLINTQGLADLPLSEWESIFDPTAKMIESAQYGFSGSIITNYSMGICTVFLGWCQDKDYSKSFSIDGQEYTIRSIESQDDGTIVIEGYVQENFLGNREIFEITDVAPPPPDAQVPSLYIVAGIGVAIAVGFFVWSDKKSKKTSTEQTGIDPKDLCAIPIGSSAGSYQTNRGTSYLRET